MQKRVFEGVPVLNRPHTVKSFGPPFILEKIDAFWENNLDVHKHFSFRFDLGGSKPVYRRSAYIFKPLFLISFW